MTIGSPLVFYTLASLAVACAFLVVLKRNPVSSAFALVLAFFCFSGIYALLGAHLLAALQVLIYAGAVMVLFVFVIMLLNAGVPSLDLERIGAGAMLTISAGSVGLLGLFVSAFKSMSLLRGSGIYTPEAIVQSGGNTRVTSEVMFSEYILPFELTSVLLLVAIVSVVAIAMRKKITSLGRTTQ